MTELRFEWDDRKDLENQLKHNVSFASAQQAFLDTRRVIARDTKHAGAEERYYCIGKVKDGVLTVRFTFRGNAIRIIGAGYWRKGRQVYEEQNPLHE